MLNFFFYGKNFTVKSKLVLLDKVQNAYFPWAQAELSS